MLVLSKKKISLVVLTIFGCMFYIMLAKENVIGESIQVVSLPVSDKVIVVDAGHRNTR